MDTPVMNNCYCWMLKRYVKLNLSYDSCVCAYCMDFALYNMIGMHMARCSMSFKICYLWRCKFIEKKQTKKQSLITVTGFRLDKYDRNRFRATLWTHNIQVFE